MAKEKKSTINVQGTAITIISHKEDDYILLLSLDHGRFMDGGGRVGMDIEMAGRGEGQLIKNCNVESLRELTTNSTNSQRTQKEGSRRLLYVRKR